MFVGKVEREKGVVELVKACAALEGLALRLVGPARPGLPQRLERLARSRGGCWLQQVGKISWPEVVREIHQADILILPSHSEGFPNAVLEAMSLGKPVVVSDVGAMPEMIGTDGEEPCGLVVAAGEIEPLSEAIRTLAENPALRRRMGDRARARVAERYLSARVLPLLEEMWLEVGNLPGGTVKLTRRGRDDPSMARLSS